MGPDVSSFDGPRGARREDFERMFTLVNSVFTRGRRADMYELFPVLFADDNLENCRIIIHDARTVSHVAYMVRKVVIGGPTIVLASVGAVCTHEDYRGRRLASTVLDDCEKRMRKQGVDVLMISGGRGLYVRRGARTVGRQRRYTVTAANAAALPDDSLELRPGGVGDLSVLAALYDTNPVRHVRSKTDWERWLGCERCQTALARPLIARVGGTPVAYVVHRYLDAENRPISEAGEWAGQPEDVAKILAAIPGFCERENVEVIADCVADAGLIRHLDEAGIANETMNFGRTVKVLRPRALFDKLRPHLAPPACDIEVTDGGEGATFKLGADELHLPAEELARALFGDREGLLPRKLGSAGEIGRVMLESFPLPLPRYGYNYV